MKKQGRKKRTPLIEKERYLNFATHVSVWSGFLTVIGLGYGILSYHQTVKPLVDEKKLKEQVGMLENHNEQLINDKVILSEEKSKIETDLAELQKKRDEIQKELQVKDEELSKKEDEIIMANAGNYITPIIYEYMYSSVYNETNQNVKETTLAKLQELLSDTNMNESQKKSINILVDFVNEELDESSDYSDLLGYRVYIYDRKLKDMGVIQQKVE